MIQQSLLHKYQIFGGTMLPQILYRIYRQFAPPNCWNPLNWL